jgi:SAM-dependent methyltransferase
MERERFEIRGCPRCATLWCDPLRLEDEPVAEDDDAPPIEDTYLSVDDTIQAENSERLELLQEVAPARTHPRLVEIGCMHGDFVEQARRAGYDAVGLDLSENAVEWAKTHRPGMVELGTLDAATPDASVDVVAAFNVVEHMDDPGEFLEHVRRVLTPNGVLIVETPSQESIYHHVLFARGKLLAGRPGLDVGMHPGTHIFKFGKKAWKNVLRRRGFSLLEMRAKSTPLRELLAKTKRQSPIFRAGIVGFGVAARLTGLGNRVLFAARR